MKMGGIMLGTHDSKSLSDFYSKVFEKQPEWVQDDWFGYEIEGGSVVIGPHSEVSGTNSQPARIMLNFTSAEPKKEFDRIKELGATVIADPYEAGNDDMGQMTISTFADPDGNYFQVTTAWE